MVSPVLFSSATDNHATPRGLIRFLESAGVRFDLDVCAESDNAVCSNYFDKQRDGLAQRWEGVCWHNPPYGEPEQPCPETCTKKKCVKRGWCTDVYIPGIIDWMGKAFASYREGAIVYCLVPSRTDTEWWHTYVEPFRRGWEKGYLHFFQGRLKFGNASNSAPFPSCVGCYG